jgi:hypothetical protein
MASKVVERKREDGSVIYRINRETGEGNYYVNSDSSQAKFITEITLEGFTIFPKILYPTGFGLRVSGLPLLQELHSRYGARLRLTLSTKSSSSIKAGNRIVRVVLNERSLVQVNRVVSDVKRKKAAEIREIVSEFLGKEFPSEFVKQTSSMLAYKPNTIADLLEDETVLEALSDRDEDVLKTISAQLIGDMKFTLRSAKQVRIISETIKASQKVYLEKTIETFKKKLGGNNSESVWQRFLRDHILTLLNVYAIVIEKQNVSLDVKIPDFMLIDAYGYIDIYEIKKPQTPLLRYDKGRGNYFWDAEISRAIVQTEKYISNIERHRFELESRLRKSGSDARIVRPSGFIIAGKRSGLNTQEMAEDFRVLNDSLKNLDVICFDDLLDNLVALHKRLTDGKTGK